MSTGHAVLDALLKSNATWAAAVNEKEPELFATLTKAQAPKVLWLGCADSRIPESVVLAAKPGDVFVHRNIGGQLKVDDDNVQAVLDYSIRYLKVRHVIVAGHSNCGACIATHALATTGQGVPPGPITRFVSELIPIAKEVADGGVQAVVEANVKHQVQNVLNSPTVKDIPGVYVHGWVYQLETGTIKDLNITVISE